LKRLVVSIDEDKCNGCGLCVPSCAEGALQIVNGKARLVSDVLCDGLGACLGDCPQGALTVEEREAPAFDEEIVKEHLARTAAAVAPKPAPVPAFQGGGCPGAAAMTLGRPAARGAVQPLSAQAEVSELTNWPVQLMLMPVRAPYLSGADLLVCADCVPFAYPNFHRDLVRGKVVAIGCPKLDDARHYVEKLATLLRDNDVNSVTVAHMEVPCCSGIVRIVRDALALSGKDIPARDVMITISGELVG
jgi:Pyruvate/2-oxoacid:ferredoxin oxidoreductase delta subunit